jgi:hypothetical protein
MSSKKHTISNGLSAMAIGTSMATGMIAGVEMDIQHDPANQDDREVLERKARNITN